MKTTKIFMFGIFLLLGMGLVSAQGNGVQFQQGETISMQELNQYRNMFEEKHQNFICEGECIYGENNQSQVTLQIRNEKRFLFWTVDYEGDYILNEEGEIIQTKYNFWARVLDWNRLRVGE